MRPTRPATPMTPILTSAIAAFLPEAYAPARFRLTAQRRERGARRDHFRVHAQFDDRAAARLERHLESRGEFLGAVTTAPNAP